MSDVNQRPTRSERPMLTQQALHELSAAVPGPHVSIYLPLHRALPESKQNELSYQSEVQTGLKRLQEAGLAAADVQAIGAQLASVPVSVREWGHPVATLAIFWNASGLRVIPLVLSVPQRVAVGETFLLGPLLRELHLNRPYHVLAFSANRVALFEGDAWGLHELAPSGLPTSLEDALGSQVVGRALYQQRAAGGAGTTPAYQGQGAAGDERGVDRERFHRAVAQALASRLKDRAVPLVLAADSSHQGEFRQLAKLPQLLEEGLRGSPDHLSSAQLHEGTWPLVQKHVAASKSQVATVYENACKVRKVVDLLGDLGVAAVSGRLRRLWLEAERRVPGRLDPESGRILEADESDLDVLDGLCVAVFRHRGEVRVVDQGCMPVKTGAFGELR